MTRIRKTNRFIKELNKFPLTFNKRLIFSVVHPNLKDKSYLFIDQNEGIVQKRSLQAPQSNRFNLGMNPPHCAKKNRPTTITLFQKIGVAGNIQDREIQTKPYSKNASEKANSKCPSQRKCSLKCYLSLAMLRIRMAHLSQTVIMSRLADRLRAIN